MFPCGQNQKKVHRRRVTIKKVNVSWEGKYAVNGNPKAGPKELSIKCDWGLRSVISISTKKNYGVCVT